MLNFTKALISGAMIVSAALLGAFSTAWAQDAYTPPEIEPGKVLILGTYHFANPGRDMFNAEADDVTTPTRQAEIERLVAALAEFDPTHVAIEGDLGLAIFNERYTAYLTGEAELNHNERQQIGFRLAKIMGHEQVYPVDYNWGLERDIPGDIFEQMNRFPEIMAELNASGQARTDAFNERIRTETIPALLRGMNNPEAMRNSHYGYARYFIMMAGEDHIPGTKMVANWYQRNLYITHNLLRLHEGPETRILVIMGFGHAYLLTQFLEESPYYDVVDPLEFIPEE